MNDTVNRQQFKERLVNWQKTLARSNECGGCEAELLGKVIAELDTFPAVEVKVDYDPKEVICELREYATQYDDGSALGRAISGTEYVMFAAANLVEQLYESAVEASSKAAIFDAAVDAAANAQRERDDLKVRIRAAEHDLHTCRRCFTCRHYYEHSERCETCFDDKVSAENGTRFANWKWRGPCAENGGVEDE